LTTNKSLKIPKVVVRSHKLKDKTLH